MTDTAWALPLDAIIEAHRGRIAGNEEIVPAVVETWHEGEDIASWTVWIGDPGDVQPRDAGLYAAKVMGGVTEADYVLFSFDTHMTSLPLNPNTGKEWVHGEMQAMCDQQGFCETGQMRDNLVICIVRRSDAKILFHSIPYHFHKPNGVDSEIIFYDDNAVMNEWDGSYEGEMQGIIPDAMREVVRDEELAGRLAAIKTALGVDEGAQLTPEEAHEVRLHMILGGVRILALASLKMGSPSMFMNVIPAQTEAEGEIIQRSAKRAGLDSESLITPVPE